MFAKSVAENLFAVVRVILRLKMKIVNVISASLLYYLIVIQGL